MDSEGALVRSLLVERLKHNSYFRFPKTTPTVGLEPTIPGLEDRCLIHWATRALYRENIAAQCLRVQVSAFSGKHTAVVTKTCAEIIRSIPYLTFTSALHPFILLAMREEAFFMNQK